MIVKTIESPAYRDACEAVESDNSERTGDSRCGGERRKRYVVTANQGGREGLVT